METTAKPVCGAVCYRDTVGKQSIKTVPPWCIFISCRLGMFSFMQVQNRPWLAQVFVYSLAGPRDQRYKHCVAMVSSSALPASNTKDSRSLVAFSITPIVSGRAEDKQKNPYTTERQVVSHYILYIWPLWLSVHHYILLQENQCVTRTFGLFLFFSSQREEDAICPVHRDLM